ncbi:MAG: hypothetical protein ACRC2T_19465, partial [Thermoguttaceae bacterium]
SICVPPLEDITEDYWQKKLCQKEQLALAFEIGAYCFEDNTGCPPKAYMPSYLFEKNISVSPRDNEEAMLVQRWLHSTPPEIFPEKSKTKKTPKSWRQIEIPKTSPMTSGKHRLMHFQRIDNRYPGDPNCPETWQGWKELEESLTPSTMRDEIRLTRILIQYCDTEDEAVLTELKDWFKDMNEIQRTVMAKNICDLALHSCDTKLLEPYKKIYGAIKEYDIAAKSDSMKKYLEDAGL